MPAIRCAICKLLGIACFLNFKLQVEILVDSHIRSMPQVIIADVGEKDSPYNQFLSAMPSGDCRYGGQEC